MPANLFERLTKSRQTRELEQVARRYGIKISSIADTDILSKPTQDESVEMFLLKWLYMAAALNENPFNTHAHTKSKYPDSFLHQNFSVRSEQNLKKLLRVTFTELRKLELITHQQKKAFIRDINSIELKPAGEQELLFTLKPGLSLLCKVVRSGNLILIQLGARLNLDDETDLNLKVERQAKLKLVQPLVESFTPNGMLRFLNQSDPLVEKQKFNFSPFATPVDQDLIGVMLVLLAEVPSLHVHVNSHYIVVTDLDGRYKITIPKTLSQAKQLPPMATVEQQPQFFTEREAALERDALAPLNILRDHLKIAVENNPFVRSAEVLKLTALCSHELAKKLLQVVLQESGIEHEWQELEANFVPSFNTNGHTFTLNLPGSRIKFRCSFIENKLAHDAVWIEPEPVIESKQQEKPAV